MRNTDLPGNLTRETKKAPAIPSTTAIATAPTPMSRVWEKALIRFSSLKSSMYHFRVKPLIPTMVFVGLKEKISTIRRGKYRKK